MGKRKEKMVPIGVRISEEADARLNTLAEDVAKLKGGDTAVGRAEVVRNALTLYDAMVSEKLEGQTLILRDKDGAEREVMLAWD